MNTYCTTSKSWISRPEQVCALMHRSLNSCSDSTASLLLDNATVQREQNRCSPEQLSIIEIDLREWVIESLTEGGMINVDVVRRRALSFHPDDVIMIVASGFLAETSIHALEHLRLGLFSAENWPRAIAIACDDAMLYQIMPALTHAFYLRPTILVENVIERYTRDLVRQGAFLRRFGARIGPLASLIQRSIHKSHAKFERKIARKNGWIWEE